jgi:hypothetical protein
MNQASLREAAVPVEAWLGRALIVYEDRADALPPVRPPVVWPAFPPRPSPGEAILPELGGVYVGLSQVREFASGAALARFLSHAAAHAQAGHAARVAGLRAKLRQMARMVPHLPDSYLEGVIAQFMQDAEREVEGRAAQLFAGAGCEGESCETFDRLLEAARALAVTGR